MQVHEPCMDKMKNAYRILVVNPEGKRPLEIHRQMVG
jgi:hypothetical protein